MSTMLKSLNVSNEASSGESKPASLLSNPTYVSWISLIQNTGETVTRESVEYRKLIAYTSFAYDILNLVIDGELYNSMQYKYSTTSPYYGPWSYAIVEDSAITWNYTGGTTADSSTVPTYRYGSVTYTAQYTVKSTVYVPVAETASACYIQSVLNTTGDEFDKDLFVYKRNGDLRASDKIVTGYGVVSSENVVDVNFGTGNFDLSSASATTRTLSSSTAAVAAKSVPRTLMGANNGVATLGSDGKLTSSQMPTVDTTDVQVAGTSVTSGGVANLTVANLNPVAVVKTGQTSQTVEGSLTVGDLYVGGTRVEVVASAPASPIADTLYFITGS